MLEIKQLSFTYHDTSKDKRYGDMDMCFDLSVNRGEILSVIGASGSGKTTLLNLIAGFNQPRSGEIRINGKDISKVTVGERPVTTVFQAHNLFPHLDVYTNVAIGLDPSLKLTKQQEKEVNKSLQSVGLANFSNRSPSQLSGGQQQRVALARALVRKQEILLLDEPLAALGPAMRDEIIDLLKSLVADNKLMALFVSHQPDDALRASKNSIFIHQGKVLAMDKTSVILNNTEHQEIQDYLGEF